MKIYSSIFLLVALVVSVNAAPLPFSETFDALSDGSLATQTDWDVQGGTAFVQTNTVHGGKLVVLSETSISQELSTSNKTVWLTFLARCEEAPDADPVVTDLNTSIAFYINTNQNLVVYSNTIPVTLDTIIPTNWVRFDVYCDYDALTWNLSVNKTNVVAGFPLYSSNTTLTSVQIENASNSSVYIDELSIVDHEPITDVIDTDDDMIPDWWEQKYFGSITGAIAGGSASNGINTIKETYIVGLDPESSDRFEVAGMLGSNGTLQWTGQPGRRYSVYATTNLLSGFILLQSNILWSTSEYADLVNTNESAMFYRVYVELDD